ncbi:unnamed protein product, partial [Brachionus calyciflorus]
KEFNLSPVISKSDLVEAYKWNNQNKTIIHFKDDNCYYLSSGERADITKEDCKSFNQALLEQKWKNFDEMMHEITSIYRVKFNEDSWKLSTCSCCFWLKNYKCNHQIAIAARKKKCNFDSVGMDIPIQSNRKKGRPKNTLSAFLLQPKETQSCDSGPKGIQSNEETDEENLPKRSRIEPEEIQSQTASKSCDKCCSKMTKRRYWACPNKCGKN